MRINEKQPLNNRQTENQGQASEKLLNALGEIDNALVYGAANDTVQKKKWLKWAGLAAMLALCVSAGIFSIHILNTGSKNADNPGANGPNTYASGIAAPNKGITGTGAQEPGTEKVYLADNSIVILDVNPSIALTVDTDEKIVNANGLNEDGKAILGGMDLTGVDLTVAVNAVIGSMLQKGYLSDMQNAILVSVENQDAEKSAALQERVSAIVGTALQDGNLEGSVLSQTLNGTDGLGQMAENYNISLGKAALIQEVMSQDPTLTIEKLVPLSITEIALISQSKNISSQLLTQNGAASNKAYITQESAVEIAYGHAGASAGDIGGLEVEFDSEDGIMVYEVEFYVGTVKYEYDIDARTGQVVKFEAEDKGGNSVQPPAGSQQPGNSQPPAGSQQPGNSQPPAGSPYIGEEAAKEAALSNAGISADSVNYINAWLEYDDGRPEHYEVEFTVGNAEYKYEIDMYSGTVLAQEMENHRNHNANHHGNGGNPNGTAGSTDIGQEAAISAALSHAGISASQAIKLEADYGYDDGAAIYEIEFEYNGYEYEYEIDAATGAILEYEIDD